GTRRDTIEGDPAILDEAERSRTADALRVLSEKTVQPRRGRVGRQAVRGFRITYPRANSRTPTLTAESATLNTGNQWREMKSVTVPNITRSNPLPIVPPRMRPSSASTTKSLRWVATYTRSAMETNTGATRNTSARAGARPNAAPELWMLVIHTRWS